MDEAATRPQLRHDDHTPAYEWWTLRLELDDGARITIWFLSTDYTTLDRGTGPMVAAMLDLPDGRRATDTVEYTDAEYRRATDVSIVIGASEIRASGSGFDVTVSLPRMDIHATILPDTRRWNPGIVHGDDFGWDVLAPSAAAAVTYSLDRVQGRARGWGFLDRNWGELPVEDHFDHCWWGRGRVGEYSFVTVSMIGRGRNETTSFVHLTHPDGLLFVNAQDVAVIATTVEDPMTGYPVPGELTYTHPDRGDGGARLGFRSELMLYRGTAAERRAGVGSLTARMVGADGAYFRFFGAVSIEDSVGGEVITPVTGDATWELLYFPGSATRKI